MTLTETRPITIAVTSRAKKLVYLVGEPGAGKSTLMARLTAPYAANDTRVLGQLWFRRLWTEEGAIVGVELGRQREAFSGTDALGMAVMPDAISWISTTDWPLVLGEGDRLASAKFLSAAANGGYEVHLCWMMTSPRECARRREARGSHQAESWVKGRRTKVDRLVQGWKGALHLLGGGSSEDLAKLRAITAL